MRAVFSWSYQRLSLPGRRLFQLLGLHFGPDVAMPAVASLAGMPREQVRPALAEVARAHLVTERIPGRFAFHDLLRAYATEVAYTHDSEGYRFAARHRMLDHYLHTACRADELLNRLRDRPFTLTDASPGVTPERPADQKQALAWFESEHAVLLTALRNSVGFDTHVWQLAWVLVSFFEFQGRWRDWRDSQRLALDASRRLSEKPAQAHSHLLLGSVSIRLTAMTRSQTHLQHALDLFRELGDDVGQADAHHSFVSCLIGRVCYREALPHAQAGARPVSGGRPPHRAGQSAQRNGLVSRAARRPPAKPSSAASRPWTCNARPATSSARPRRTTAWATPTAVSATGTSHACYQNAATCTVSSVTFTTKLTPSSPSATPTNPSAIPGSPGSPGKTH